jgi:hypothetical protein
MGPRSYNDRMLIQIDGALSTRCSLDLDLIDAVNEIRCSRSKKFSLDRSESRAYYFALGLD